MNASDTNLRRRRLLVTSAPLVMAVALLCAMTFPMPQPGRAAAAAGPDLTVEVSLLPTTPVAGQEVTIRVVARNIGTSNAAERVEVHLYVDPPDRPPTPTTLGFPIISIPGLAAGDTAQGERTHTFTTNDCNHVIYAWIDRDGGIAESDETNNLVALPVCVGVVCEPDGYEEDNSCSAAGLLSENASQARSFCRADDHTLADEDWVKFTAFAGVTYTLAATNQGANAAPQFELYGACGAAPLTDGDDQVAWRATGDGVLYARLRRADGVSGPLTAYSLTLSSATGVTDDYEPDNRCADARDIPTNGVRQTRLFQAPGDEDWVKFTVSAGESFIIIADNTAPGVNPLVTVFSSCSQVDANASLGPSAAQVAQSSTTDAVYFARIRNQNPANFGAAARYDLAVTAAACAPDGEEGDNDRTQARMVTVGAAARTHNFCPASDEDWVKFSAKKGKVYVLQTTNLAFASDTVLHLYDTDGTTELAQNDDYGYTSGSRIVWEAPADGLYFAKVRHANPVASGPNTQYDLAVQEGVCAPDSFEGGAGNNGPGDAPLVATNGVSQTHTFCADALNPLLGDQDWVAFNAVAGGNYQIVTTGLGANSDTVLELYDRDGARQLLHNDDVGAGRGAMLTFTPTLSGAYFVRVTQFNPNLVSRDADYQLQIFGTEPPTPTPTPTLTPTPSPTPSPTATPQPSTVKTLIVVNRERIETLHGAGPADTLFRKLSQFANDSDVEGVVVEVERDPAVAAAYAAWTADATTLADHELANNTVAAIRNRVMGFLASAPQARHVVIIGDDRVVPFRRVLDRVAPTGKQAASVESVYAQELTEEGTVYAALAANMILTDDYLVDREPSQWQDRQQNEYELFVPDYAVGRLVEEPDEIIAVLDNFLAGDKMIGAANALVTGYDFVQDSADLIKTLFRNDAIPTDAELIGASWTGDALRAKYLTAAPRYDLYSVNGHSTHLAAGAPDGSDMTAAQILAATTDLRGVLVFSLGCHSGLNEPGVLDLPQAFLRKQAHYVGNTGFGWGGGGVVFSEALMRNFARELLRDTEAAIGPALMDAKRKYVSQARRFDAFDAKVLMQMTLYGLPMVRMQSGGALTDDDPFPSAQPQFTPPTSFGSVAEGAAGYRLPSSFGAFGAQSSDAGATFELDGNVAFGVDEPLQPLYYTDVSAPAVGPLRGAVFLGGVYSDTVNVDPVIGAPLNEYVTDRSEPAFYADEFYPAAPFTIRSSDTISGAADTLVMNLGQFQSGPDVAAAAAGRGVVRLYDQMSFGVYYSTSPDRNAANIETIDGVLDPDAGMGRIKVDANDASGVRRVVVAFTEGQGQWLSKDLTFDEQAQKWTGVITGTVNTRFFVQVVDNAGNVAVNENKGRYYRLAEPVPLAEGRPLMVERRVYLPLVNR